MPSARPQNVPLQRVGFEDDVYRSNTPGPLGSGVGGAAGRPSSIVSIQFPQSRIYRHLVGCPWDRLDRAGGPGNCFPPRRLETAQGELDVGTLAERAGVSIATASQHLGKLRLAGVITARREGRRQIYTVDDPHVLALIDQIFTHIAPDGSLAPDQPLNHSAAETLR